MILHGDCLETLKTFESNSIDAIVTDPPYGIAFMGKRWDYDVPSVEVWRECLRVLKPGGHMLAFGGTRTYHRLVTAIEDAGFEIRDQIQWIFGQGFPKSLDVSKAIDKEAGATREVVGYYASPEGTSGASNHQERIGTSTRIGGLPAITAPATDSAREWEGWGTALKPANEPICLARKPLSESTVAKNVLKWGTGALNIDGCRVGSGGHLKWERPRDMGFHGGTDTGPCAALESTQGRFPANLILDEESAAALDAQSGVSDARGGRQRVEDSAAMGYHGGASGGHQKVVRNDSGGTSRFFYVAKASKADRGEGNGHPTVKPTALMAYLCRLITPPGGLVLDPFAGSGSTGVGALREGFRFVGIEREDQYVAIAAARVEAVS